MKKVLSILVLIMILLIGNSFYKSYENKDTYFYLGHSDSWLVTYSISKVESSCYDSLTIQYVFDESKVGRDEQVGPIEYQLAGNSMKMESSFPQELQGIGNLHTGSRINTDIYKMKFDKEMEISIQWQSNMECIKLIKQN